MCLLVDSVCYGTEYLLVEKDEVVMDGFKQCQLSGGGDAILFVRKICAVLSVPDREHGFQKLGIIRHHLIV